MSVLYDSHYLSKSQSLVSIDITQSVKLFSYIHCMSSFVLQWMFESCVDVFISNIKVIFGFFCATS